VQKRKEAEIRELPLWKPPPCVVRATQTHAQLSGKGHPCGGGVGSFLSSSQTYLFPEVEAVSRPRSFSEVHDAEIAIARFGASIPMHHMRTASSRCATTTDNGPARGEQEPEVRCTSRYLLFDIIAL
jgi:hypothetical protein